MTTKVIVILTANNSDSSDDNNSNYNRKNLTVNVVVKVTVPATTLTVPMIMTEK